jgi:hypothetical protein
MRRIKHHCIVKNASFGGAKFFSRTDPYAPERENLRRSNDVTKTETKEFIGTKVTVEHQQDCNSCSKASLRRQGNMIGNTCADWPRKWMTRELGKHPAPPAQGSAEVGEVARLVLRELRAPGRQQAFASRRAHSLQVLLIRKLAKGGVNLCSIAKPQVKCTTEEQEGQD